MAPPFPQALLTLHGRRLPLTGRPKGVAGAPAIPPLHIAFAAIGGDDYFATASDDDEDDEPLLDDEDSEDEEGDDEVDDADLGMHAAIIIVTLFESRVWAIFYYVCLVNNMKTIFLYL